jgi:NAD(P)-dependent dehydrogenase (short-subunit alcohol dehydrogenase family)
MNRFEGKTAIITGAGSGIGKATAILFAHEGADVVLADLRNSDGVAKEIKTLKGRALPFEGDVSDSQTVNRMVSVTCETFGKVDILINCVAIGRPGKIEDIPEKDWDETLRVNVKSYFLCCRAVVPIMKRHRNGKIVNVSSIAGRDKSLINGIHYTTSKAAIIGFTRHLATELAPFKINVNAVCPGPTLTPFFTDYVSQENHKKIQQRVPLGYISQPEEQARVILFLASEDASYITGGIVDVNGGLL